MTAALTVPELVRQQTPRVYAQATSSIDPDLILAMVWQESTGDESAWNPEPRFRWFWNVKTNAPFRAVTEEEIASERPPADFPCLRADPDQEWWAQQASWGLMQVMGSVARENGFKAPYIPRLIREPDLGLQIGIQQFRKHLRRRNGDIRAALLRYNGGGNLKYPDEVLEKHRVIKTARLTGAAV